MNAIVSTYHDLNLIWTSVTRCSSIGVHGIVERTGIDLDVIEEVTLDWCQRRLIRVKQFGWARTPSPRYEAARSPRWTALGEALNARRGDMRPMLLGDLLGRLMSRADVA
jgi:hypothetical protein